MVWLKELIMLVGSVITLKSIMVQAILLYSHTFRKLMSNTVKKLNAVKLLATLVIPGDLLLHIYITKYIITESLKTLLITSFQIQIIRLINVLCRKAFILTHTVVK